ncbi:MAG: VOC family protein [Pseudomonadota bacterium]
MEIDHLVISCGTLEAGADAVLLPWLTGGVHRDFGTHNRLLSLGPEAYLELIAVNPDAPPLGRPRWFDLDRFTGPPRLTNWVLRVDDLAAIRARLGPDFGEIHDLARDTLRWRMAVPPRGILPFDNCAPALIQWLTPPPMPKLNDQGHRLASLEVHHPEAGELEALLGLRDPHVTFSPGEPRLTATLSDGDTVIPLP